MRKKSPQEEQKPQSTYFDLNALPSPELTEIPDDHGFSNIQTYAPILEKGKGISSDVGFSSCNTIDTENYSQLSGNKIVVPAINLQDDFTMEGSVCDPSKLRKEAVYSSQESFLSLAEHANLPRIPDDTYSLGFSNFGGTDISGCLSAPAADNSRQTTTTLSDAQQASMSPKEDEVANGGRKRARVDQSRSASVRRVGGQQNPKPIIVYTRRKKQVGNLSNSTPLEDNGTSA